MDKRAIHDIAIKLGYVGDRFGNLVSPSGKTRLKFQATSLRVERAFRPSPSEWNQKPAKEWLNLVSDYYCNIVPHGETVAIKGKKLVAVS